MSNIILTLALLAVLVILCLGLFNMMRAGPANRSQSLMRWRVIAQFVAIVLAVLVLWLKRG